jgi:hypothetical protein
MANQYPTIEHVLANHREGGRFEKPVRLLSQKYPFAKMLPMVECNKTDSHEFSFQFSLPDPTYRIYNQGIYSTKGADGKTEERTTMLADRMTADLAELELNGNKEEFLAEELQKHYESLYQEVERGFFYNSTSSNPNRFNGLSTRLAALNSLESKQIVTPGISTANSDQTSAWLAVLSPESIFSIYPRGTPAGLKQIDWPIPQQLDDGTGATFPGVMVDLQWKLGLCVKDWRQMVRMPNFDTSAILTTDFNIIPTFTKAMHRIENLLGGKAGFFINRFMEETLDLQCQNNSRQASLEKYIEGEGGPRTAFRGIPIYVTDAITNTEAIVS